MPMTGSDDNIVSLHPSLPAMIEELLERVRSGEVIGVATVCVNKDRTVVIEWDGPDNIYHELNSGAARLAYKLAASDD